MIPKRRILFGIIITYITFAITFLTGIAIHEYSHALGGGLGVKEIIILDNSDYEEGRNNVDLYEDEGTIIFNKERLLLIALSFALYIPEQYFSGGESSLAMFVYSSGTGSEPGMTAAPIIAAFTTFILSCLLIAWRYNAFTLGLLWGNAAVFGGAGQHIIEISNNAMAIMILATSLMLFTTCAYIGFINYLYRNYSKARYRRHNKAHQSDKPNKSTLKTPQATKAKPYQNQ